MSNQKAIIGIFGSFEAKDPEVSELAYDLGRCIIERYTILTGACKGYPLEASRGAYENRESPDRQIIGISPFENESEHIQRGMTADYHDIVIYTGLGSHLSGKRAYSSRNIINVNTIDGCVVLPGSEGTILELRLSLSKSKPTIVLTGLDGAFDTAVQEIRRNTDISLFHSAIDPSEILDYFVRLWA